MAQGEVDADDGEAGGDRRRSLDDAVTEDNQKEDGGQDQHRCQDRRKQLQGLPRGRNGSVLDLIWNDLLWHTVSEKQLG